MGTIEEVLRHKGSEVFSSTPDATVYDAIRLMAVKQIGALVVLDAEEIVGILSERDYARNVILEGRTSKETPVRDIMTNRVVYVRPSNTIDEALALMTDKRIRHLPVLQEGKLVGMVSIGDLVKVKLSDQEFLIEQLEQYISGQ